MNRRKLIKLGLSATALAFMPFGCLTLSDNKRDEFLKFISDAKLPVNPKQTGELSKTEFMALASLCTYVNKVWELTPDLDQYLNILQVDLNFKTTEEPSYLAEYKNAVELVDSVAEGKIVGDKGWATLLFAEFNDENFESTKLGRARNFVFSEIITHMIPLSGGFKTFGLWNYRGYFGGAYVSPESYRKTEIV